MNWHDLTHVFFPRSGHVMMGHYATGRVLQEAGVKSASDMTLEATACKIAYLCGRGDMNQKQIEASKQSAF